MVIFVVRSRDESPIFHREQKEIKMTWFWAVAHNKWISESREIRVIYGSRANAMVTSWQTVLGKAFTIHVTLFDKFYFFLLKVWIVKVYIIMCNRFSKYLNCLYGTEIVVKYIDNIKYVSYTKLFWKSCKRIIKFPLIE